jgi:hypothetical protein
MAGRRRFDPSFPLLAGGLLSFSMAFAAATPEELLRSELRETVARVIASGAFDGQAADTIGLTVTVPGERYIDLGLLLDRSERADAGVRVLGTTPGSNAQALGLRAGDLIATVGATRLVGLGFDDAGNPRAIGVLKASVDALPDGARLALGVVRDGRSVQFDGAVAARYLPPLRLELGEGDLVGSTGAAAAGGRSSEAAPTGCGRISTFHIAPRSRALYPARVLSIDGRIPGPAGQQTYRLAPGPHTLEVAEAIDANDLPTAFSRRRPDGGRRLLTVVVESGQTGLVAAHLLDAAGGKDYWEPQVWRSTPEPCP